MKQFNQWENIAYLGDGLWVSDNGGYIKLMAGDHLNPDDVIYLNDATFKSLLEFVKVHAEAWLREE